MCKYIGIILYDGLVEEVMAFENEMDATSWVFGQKGKYGTERTLGSVAWEVERQLPVLPIIYRRSKGAGCR